jgi:uncharacterized protein YacL
VVTIVLATVILLLSLIIFAKNIKFAIPRKTISTVILDSCALIDGRILEISKTGFMPRELVVPDFILAELQLLADGNDSHKRERARFGLEIVQQLQQEPNLSVNIERTNIGATTTDEKLVKLAKKSGAALCTIDFNLNQVASIEGVKVLNVNELSHAIRPIALPGEGLEVKVLQAGSSRDQGVGYMEDGTMVVIDGARRDVGKMVKVSITRTHQTVAGKMLFASKIVDNADTKKSHRPRKSR